MPVQPEPSPRSQGLSQRTFQVMLQDLLGVALCLHLFMVVSSWLQGQTTSHFFFWEGFFAGLSAAAWFWVRTRPSSSEMLWMVRIFVLACGLRWTSAWWGDDPHHLYTSLVSVGLYVPMLMLTTAPLQASNAFWIPTGAVFACVAAGASFQPHLQGSVFSEARLAPAIFLTMLLCLRHINRWKEHIQHLQEGHIREAALTQAARTDSLTGLLNRQGIEQELAQQQSRDEIWSVLLVDVDHFKQVNDKHGHLTGDLSLQDVAWQLRTGVRVSDHVARWGGEEFLILLRDTQLRGALQVAEKLCNAIETRSLAEGQVPLTVSIGVASGTAKANPEQVIQAADDALYAAKRGGRNRVCLAS